MYDGAASNSPTTLSFCSTFIGVRIMQRVRFTDEQWADFIPARYLNTNTVDPDMDIDGSAEFGDIDNEFLGLTIIECADVLSTARFLNGYDL